MTGKERREQLLDIGRRLFAERGLDGTSIEEIAAQAGVSKPVVYEHFGGKEGLYAVVVDREVERFLTMATRLLEGEDTMAKFEVAAVHLLRYIQENSDGFRILVRDSNPTSGSGTFASLISDIASQVEYILGDVLKVRGYDPKLAPVYAQMLVGMVASAGQWWLDERKPKLEEMAAHLVNLAWNGMRELDPKPRLSAEALELLRQEKCGRPVAAAGGRASSVRLCARPRRPAGTAARCHRASPGRSSGPARNTAVVNSAASAASRAASAGRIRCPVPVGDRVRAGQHVQVGGLPGVDRQPRPASSPGSRPGRRLPVQPTPASWPRHRGELASSRSSAWTGWSKLPGTWNAIQPPAAKHPAQRGSRSRCPGTHCSMALEMITSAAGRLPAGHVADGEAQPAGEVRARRSQPLARSRSSRLTSQCPGSRLPASGCQRRRQLAGAAAEVHYVRRMRAPIRPASS